LSRAPTYAAGSQIPTYNQYGAQIGGYPNYYAPTPIQARDQNAIELYGLRVGSTVTAHEICTTAIGQVVAQLILQRGPTSATLTRSSYRGSAACSSRWTW